MSKSPTATGTAAAPAVVDPPPTGSSTAVSSLVIGCVLVGASSSFIKLSETTATTAAFFRCALALIAFAPAVALEWRRRGLPPRRMVLLGLLAGFFLGCDYLMWTQSILDSGAAVATVLIGVQVVAFPILSRIFLGDAIARRFLLALPLMIIGLGLTGGLLTADEAAPHPTRGAILGVSAGICYAAYLMVHRPASHARPSLHVTPVACSTLAAAVVIGSVGAATGQIDVTLPARSWFWLAAVALCGQALSFVLIGYGLSRLTTGVAAALMLLQPVAAVVLGTLVLGERPAAAQYLGMLLTLTAVLIASLSPRRRRARAPHTGTPHTRAPRTGGHDRS